MTIMNVLFSTMVDYRLCGVWYIWIWIVSYNNILNINETN